MAVEKQEDVDAIEAEEARLAKEKEIAQEAELASPRARAQQIDAERVQADAEIELAAARAALSQYEAHLVSVSERVAKVKQDKEEAKRQRKVRSLVGTSYCCVQLAIAFACPECLRLVFCRCSRMANCLIFCD